MSNRRWMAIVLATLLAASVLSLSASRGLGGVDLPARFKTYDSRYYVIQTDLEGDQVRETTLRMTKMAEEYHDRTRDFSGVISNRLPFMIFKNASDYYAAGGPPRSAGVFDGEKLMAIAGEKVSDETWHVVQHEGFHQFARAVIRGDLPIWVNEGLAEYFGQGVFTGDGFITGLIPHGRMERIKESMKDRRVFIPVSSMMDMSHAEWNRQMRLENYDQAWSMVHFLAHGEDGKYQKAFSGYMTDLGRGRDADRAWQDNFGDANGFEERWRKYWTELPDNPTGDLYCKASIAILTSFAARATASKQTFDGFEDFDRQLKNKSIKVLDADWLPPQLGVEAAELAQMIGKCSIEKAGPQPVLVAETKQGTRFIGTFKLKGNRVDSVNVETDDLKVILAKANELITANPKEREKARRMVLDSMRLHPKSQSFEGAKKFLADHK